MKYQLPFDFCIPCKISVILVTYADVIDQAYHPNIKALFDKILHPECCNRTKKNSLILPFRMQISKYLLDILMSETYRKALVVMLYDL